MNVTPTSAKNHVKALCLFAVLFINAQNFAQKPTGSKLDKMPAALETDYALSSLPPQLRQGATVYLLDPAKGYYVARKGSNEFICFVMRTAWEWAEFRNDIVTAISYDAEGAKAIFPIYFHIIMKGDRLLAADPPGNHFAKLHTLEINLAR